MDVLDRYLALPAELQYIIYNMLPRCTQRAMDNEPFQGDFLDCVKQDHIGCVRHLIQTTDFNRIYYCIYDERLLNWAIERRHLAMLKTLVEDVVKHAERCDHGFSYYDAQCHLQQMKDGIEKKLICEVVAEIIKCHTDFYSRHSECHHTGKRRRINEI